MHPQGRSGTSSPITGRSIANSPTTYRFDASGPTTADSCVDALRGGRLHGGEGGGGLQASYGGGGHWKGGSVVVGLGRCGLGLACVGSYGDDGGALRRYALVSHFRIFIF